MVSKIKATLISMASFAAVIGVISFTGIGTKGQAGAQSAINASAIRCFVGNTMDRPDTHMTRGWVCMPEHTPVVMN